MNFLQRLLGNTKVDVLEGKDGSIVERLTTTHRGHKIQINRHDRDDNQVTLAVDDRMIPRIMSMDDVDDSIEANT